VSRGATLHDAEHWCIEGQRAGRTAQIERRPCHARFDLCRAGGREQEPTIEQWRTVNQYNGFFRIVSRLSSKCLTVPGASTADGARRVQLPCNGSASQDFKLVQQ
jgi:hypothetical protein